MAATIRDIRERTGLSLATISKYLNGGNVLPRNRELIEAALERNGVLGYFGKIFTCTETGAGKDDPLIYLEAAQFLESGPDETLVFEDAFHAAETAKKAGFTVFGIYDDSNRENLSRMKELCDFYFDRMDIWLEDFPEKSEKK